MAGAFGSIQHFHEDKTLTFGEIKTILNKFVDGKQIIYEKFDGQNLLVTIQDGQVKVARNKASLNRPFSLIQLQAAFPNQKEHIKTSFSEAILALEDYLYQMDMLECDAFFKDGNVFLNCEIINPLTRNQIDYGTEKKVIFTGAVVTDGNGKIISNLHTDALYIFHPSQINDWSIELYSKLDYNVNSIIDEVSDALADFMNIYELNDSDTVNKFTEKVIYKLLDKFQLTQSQRASLKSRWVYGDKSLRLNHINYGMSAAEISMYEKSQFALDLIEIENAYTSIMQGFGNALIQSISESNERMNNISTLMNVYIESLKYAQTMEFNIDKHLLSIVNMGGITNVRNIEGIVFYHNDNKLYKITGLFQPINQICGYLKYRK